MTARVIHGGFSNNCRHDVEVIILKKLSIAFCCKCGFVYYGDEWFELKVLIATLLVDEDEEMAMTLFNIMNIFRKSRIIKYSYIPEEELRRSAAIMKKQLKKNNP